MHLEIRNFMKAVTTAGTREQLTTLSKPVPAFIISAEYSNTGSVYVGDKNVSSAVYSFELKAGDTATISASELGWPYANVSMNSVWLDAAISSDGVAVCYLETIDN